MSIKKFYPCLFKVVKENPYRIPIGSVLRGRYKEGDASPFPVLLYLEKQVIQMRRSEVEELEKRKEGNKNGQK